MRTAASAWIQYIRLGKIPKPMEIKSINLKQLVEIRELTASKMVGA